MPTYSSYCTHDVSDLLKLFPYIDKAIVRLLQVSLEQYVQRISEAEEETKSFRVFRERWPSRFLELCKLHLAVLIDLPSEFFEDNSTEFCSKPCSGSEVDGRWWPLRSFSRLRSNSHSAVLTPNSNGNSTCHRCANNAVKDNLLTLMEVLNTETNLSVEGIFRKPGNVNRQRVIKHRVLSGQLFTAESLIDMQDVKFDKKTLSSKKSTRRWLQNQLGHSSPHSTSANVHDLASSLKGVLYDLPEPLFTQRLLPLYIEVANLFQEPTDENGVRTKLCAIDEKIIKAKQLKALRLLHLLLPKTHTVLLEKLLNLLTNTLKHAQTNRMSADSLGTLFSPSLLSPNKMATTDLANQYKALSSLISLMITHGFKEISLIPKTFVQDIRRNQRLLESSFICKNPTNSQSEILSRAESSDEEKEKPLTRSTSRDSGLGWNDSSRSASDTDSYGKPTNQEDMPALVTCISFIVRNQADIAMNENLQTIKAKQTEYAVAELCATIQALPDTDPRKRRLVQRFNASNGGLISLPRNDENAMLSSRSASALSFNDIRGTRCPSTVSFQRPTTSNPAYRAAKTIRSSLRRKLAMRSNLHLSATSRLTIETPIVESCLELAEEEQEHETPIRKINSMRRKSSTPPHIPSPTFDGPQLNRKYSRSYPRLTTNMAPNKARHSLLSVNSTDTNEHILCCPLFASPFRKRPFSHDSVTNPHAQLTPVNRLRRGMKRLRCPSPPPAPEHPAADTDCIELFEDDGTYDAYSPIMFNQTQVVLLKRLPNTSPKKQCEPTSTNGRRSLLTQTTLHDYGYPTVGRQTVSPQPKLQRCNTMPSLLVPC